MSRTLTSHSSIGITLTGTAADSPFTIAASGAITPTTGDGLIAKGKASYNWTVDNFGTVTSTPSSTHGIYLGPGTAIASGTVTNESGGLISSGGYGIVINGPGFVTNKAGGTISAANFKAIYLIGTGTVVNAGMITAGNVAVYEANGGAITNQSGGTISGNGGVWFEAPGTFTNFGVVIGTNAGFGAVLFNSTSGPNRFIDEPGGTLTGNIIAQIGGTDVIELASAASVGTLSGFGTSITNFDTLQFDSGARWTIAGSNNTTIGLGGITIQGFAAGDTIDLTGFAAVSKTFASNALVLTNAANAHTTLHIQGVFSTADFQISSDLSGGTDIAVCFAAGTLILTTRGQVLVEHLTTSDHAVTVSDGVEVARPVKWVGRRQIDLTAHPRPATVAPVRIARGAITDTVPRRDLLVSPDHAIFIDGMLICARQLINGTTIRQDTNCRSIEYFHVELDAHALIQAEGLAAESYLDTGNRGFFSNSGTPLELHPNLVRETSNPTRTAGSCAPFVSDAASVRPVWRRLADRANTIAPRAARPHTTTEPALRLLAGGNAIRPVSGQAGLIAFVLPRDTAEVRLVSRAGSPSDARPWLEDRRQLGVRVARIWLRYGSDVCDLPLDSPELSSGWWAVEQDGNLMCRWTNGDAILRLPTFLGPSTLEVQLDSEMIYVMDPCVAVERPMNSKVA